MTTSKSKLRWLSPRSLTTLVPLASLSVVCLFVVEANQRNRPSPWYGEMLQAAELSARAAAHIKSLRLERGVFVDPVNDPAESALIGQEYTQITTDRGYLDAKLASLDPNFAAVVVRMLRELGVDKEKCAAIAATGSFPALNISVLAAVQTLEINTVVAASVGASNYGANDPYFTWVDMYQALVDAQLITAWPSIASIGGGGDNGRGLSPRGRTLAREAIARVGMPLIEEEQLEKSVQRRMSFVREQCGERSPDVYINVGGGVASLGHAANSALIPNGASERVPARNFPFRGALLRFSERGVPVIHLARTQDLAARYQLMPFDESLPMPGQGDVFGEVSYGIAVPLAALSLLLGLLVAVGLIDQREHRLGGHDSEER